MSDQNNQTALEAQIRVDVVAASLAVLVRALQEAGVTKPAAMACLRDAPDKIEAALTRGAGAMIVYRMNADGPCGIVSDQTERLEAFTAEARAANAPLFGLNPYRIALIATAARLDSAPEPFTASTRN